MPFQKKKSDNKTKNTEGVSLQRILFLLPLSLSAFIAIIFSIYIIWNSIKLYNEEVKSLKEIFPSEQKQQIRFRVLEVKDFILWVESHPGKYIDHYRANLEEAVTDLLGSNFKRFSNAEDWHIQLHDSLATRCNLSLATVEIFDQKGNLFYNSRSKTHHKALKRDTIQKGVQEEEFQNWKINIRFEPGKENEIIKDFLLDSIASIRYSDDEYIFINSVDGYGLVSRGKRQTPPVYIYSINDKFWHRVYAKQRSIIAKSPGGFIEYDWNKEDNSGVSKKISYITYVPGWNWIVGTGMHANKLDILIAERRDALQKSIFNSISRFLIFLSIAYFSFYWIIRWIANMTGSNIKLFVHFFRRASYKSEPIDLEKVHFVEFTKLAQAANNMLTEREKIKSVLNNEQSRLKQVIDSIPDLIFFKDVAGYFIGCNTAFEKFISRKAKDIIGLSEFELFPKEKAETYTRYDKIVMESLQPFRNNEWHNLPDGKKILLDTIKVPYFVSNNRLMGMIMISRDITEIEETRQRLLIAKEKAEESDRLKTAFLANMSHEIRTPMNAIIGFSDLLSDETIDAEEKKEFTNRIKIAGESLMNIINDIIDIAKIEAGQLSIVESECNLTEILTELYGIFNEIKERSGKSAIELKLVIPVPAHPFIVKTDPLRLQQVLNNLLSNAFKFTEFGSIEYGYGIDDKVIRFYVKDTGIGILRSKKSLLFQRFSQIDSGKTRKYGGTGLGLAISKNIVELLGGEIGFDSEPGIGSTFYFTIPNKPVNSADISDLQEIDASQKWNDKKILVVDDLEQNFTLLEALLHKTGIQMLYSPSGIEALEFVRNSTDISIILTDIQMPGMTGYELTREIHNLRPDIPVIAYTSYALPNERQKSKEAGCTDYLPKPFKIDFLLALLQKYLDEEPNQSR